MRTVQEIFNVVIEAGIYNPMDDGDYFGPKSQWMCYALDFAEDLDVISYAERVAAQHAIREYIPGDRRTMSEVLYALEGTMRNAGISWNDAIPDKCADRLIELYSNWDERPELPEDLFDAYP